MSWLLLYLLLLGFLRLLLLRNSSSSLTSRALRAAKRGRLMGCSQLLLLRCGPNNTNKSILQSYRTICTTVQRRESAYIHHRISAPQFMQLRPTRCAALYKPVIPADPRGLLLSPKPYDQISGIVLQKQQHTACCSCKGKNEMQQKMVKRDTMAIWTHTHPLALLLMQWLLLPVFMCPERGY